MTRDIIQLIVWAVFGSIITWGIFLAWVGFREGEIKVKPRLSKSFATFTFIIGSLWILIWVSAVIVNIIQIIGVGGIHQPG